MSKEKTIQEYEYEYKRFKRLIDKLSKMTPMEIANAYFHALDYTLHDEDVTKGYYDASQK